MSEATPTTAAATTAEPAVNNVQPTTPADNTQAQPNPADAKAKEIKASGGLLTLNKGEAKTEGEQADPNAKPELIAGKYKTVDDLVKAHKELETKLGKGPEVPETYEFEEITKAGITLGDEAQQAEVVKMFKDLGFTQEQVNKLPALAQHAGKINFDAGIEFAKKALGNDPEFQDAQIGLLRKDWGDSFDARFKAVQEFSSKFPTELWDMPLKNSALGWALAERYMQEHAGPNFASTDTATTDNSKARLDQIVADPDYYRQGAKGDQLRREAADISARMNR